MTGVLVRQTEIYKCVCHVEYGDPAPPPEMLKFMASLCRAYRLMAAPLVTPALIADLRAELDILRALAVLLPPTICRQPLHYMQHFPEHMLLFGPTIDHCMWAYESMFGYLKGLLKSRKHPVANVLKAWALGFALQTVEGRLHHSQYMDTHHNPPDFTPDNRSRMHKDATLGTRKKAAQILDLERCAQVKAWYRQQPTYAEMERLHAAAIVRAGMNTRYNPYRGHLVRMLARKLCNTNTSTLVAYCQPTACPLFTLPPN